MTDNLLELQKKAILTAIDSVKPPSKYKCLILDSDSAKLVNQVLAEHEILDRNVSTVEQIESKRATQNYIDAMYIIRPTPLSLDCMNTDFTRVPNRYAAAHVFLLPDPNMADIMNRIKNGRIGGHIRSLQVLYIDYYPLEQCIFSLKQPQSLEIFYNKNCFNLVQNYVAQVAGQLVGLCTTFGEYPIVRFYKPDAPLNETSVLTYMIASAFHRALDEYARTHPDFPIIDESRPRSVFLITDRTMDVMAPLVHEFTYQAMAYDLLSIEDNVYKYERTEKGENIKASGNLTEKDPEWVALRHLHMQEAIELFTARLEKLKKDHPHLADQSTDASVSDLQDMVAGLPMFAEMKERFSLHLSMAGQCMDLLQKSNLMEVADIEQTCVTGATADGRKPKTLTDDFVKMLASQEVSQKDKVRLVLLYCLYRGGLVEADLVKLEKHAGLQSIDLEVIRNIVLVEGRVSKPDLNKKTAKKFPKPTTFHSAATGDVYETSRFVPGLKNVIDQLIQGTLPSSLFPYTKDEPLDDEMDMSSKAASLRNPRQRAAWAKSAQLQAPRQRIFVFVAGGFTMSEARSIYELNVQHKSKSIFLGGNDIVTPGSFLASLSRLRASRESLRLKQDQQNPTRAPAYLMEPDGANRPVATASVNTGGPPIPTASKTSTMPKPISVNSAIPDSSVVTAALGDNTTDKTKKKKTSMKKLKKFFS